MNSVVDIHKKDGIRPEFDIYIGRRVRWLDFTSDTKWGNYWGRDLSKYERMARLHLWDDLEELEGKILGCWCITTDKTYPVKCHGQILMKLLREKLTYYKT